MPTTIVIDSKAPEDPAPMDVKIPTKLKIVIGLDVDAFYYKALANGGKCNGEPGFRPQYEDGYYAAFVIDPDGHNIEAVYSEKAKVPPIVTSSNC